MKQKGSNLTDEEKTQVDSNQRVGRSESFFVP